MEISLDDLKKETTPYQKFLDSIRNPETRRKYKNMLNRFLEMVPSTIYSEILATSPKNREHETLAACFVELGSKKPDVVLKILS